VPKSAPTPTAMKTSNMIEDPGSYAATILEDSVKKHRKSVNSTTKELGSVSILHSQK
jgi:hypothetical protein